MTSISANFPQWLHCDEAEVLGHGWAHFIDPADRERVRQATDAIQAGRIPEPYTVRLIPHMGDPFVVSVSLWIDHKPSGWKRVMGTFTKQEGGVSVGSSTTGRAEDVGT